MSKLRVAPTTIEERLTLAGIQCSPTMRALAAELDKQMKIMLATAARLIVARRLADRQEQSTITPEATLREAGISTKRQARYQRRMSSLLAGRE